MVTVAISRLWDSFPLSNFHIRQMKVALPYTKDKWQSPHRGKSPLGPSPVRLAGTGHRLQWATADTSS